MEQLVQLVGDKEQVMHGVAHPTQLPPTKNLVLSKHDKQKVKDWQ